MKKRMFLLVFSAFCLSSVFTQLQAQKLVVWLKNGTKEVYQLIDKPKTTFSDGNLVITTQSVQTKYKLDKVLRYTYEGDLTKIEAAKTGHKGFRQNSTGLKLDYIPAGTMITIHNTSGVLMKKFEADGSPEISLPMSAYPTGVYIINVGNQVFKFVNK